MASSRQTFIGWFLILSGLAVIAYGLFTSFQIFTGTRNAPEIFSVKESEATAQAPTQSPTGLSEAQAQELVGQMLREQLGELLSSDDITKSFNLAAWSIFAWILIMGGGQVAGIGIKLLRS